MPKFEIRCTADAVITERWYVEAASAADACNVLTDDTRPDRKIEFIEQIGVDHEINRDIRYCREVVPEPEPVPPRRISGNDVLPALIRPGMYAGDQAGRSSEQWIADAVAGLFDGVDLNKVRRS